MGVASDFPQIAQLNCRTPLIAQSGLRLIVVPIAGDIFFHQVHSQSWLRA